MTRKEAIMDFKKTYFKPMLTETVEVIKRYCTDNKENLSSSYINFLKGAFNDFNITKGSFINEESTIAGHIYFKRTDLILRKGLKYYFKIYIDSIEDKELQYEHDKGYDLKFIYECIVNIETELEKPRKTYVGKVAKIDVKKMIYEDLDILMKDTILFFREIVINDYIENKDDYVNCKYLSILIGEYINMKKQLSYKKSKQLLLIPEIDDIKIYKWLDKNKILIATVISNINLRKGCLKEKTIINSVFKNCVIEVSNLTLSSLCNSKFIDCEIIDCSFSASDITGVNFENSCLNKVSFNFAIFNDKDIKSNINFISSKLQEVSFDYADLRCSKFIDVEMEEVSFKNASLKGAEFSKALKESEMFTEEQKAEIVWI